ncbi:hypothetical protein ATM17_12555 [Sphingopyxis macrogoltabida]|uniref:Uncharacterized protein n=2 Tax=Sphingopyxis macrogoltabida TaxID=33050 RepID=A0AAC9FFM0_SPHMC|nr:hypothetical protein ATM17_12555 [Sphingopyxis macrogoltabida]
MEPYSYHRQRREAPPICQAGGNIYREATEEELAAGYAAAFPDEPKPIATFRADVPEDIEAAKAVLSPDALNRFFGPDGGGADAWIAAIEAAGARIGGQ